MSLIISGKRKWSQTPPIFSFSNDHRLCRQSSLVSPPVIWFFSKFHIISFFCQRRCFISFAPSVSSCLSEPYYTRLNYCFLCLMVGMKVAFGMSPRELPSHSHRYPYQDYPSFSSPDEVCKENERPPVLHLIIDDWRITNQTSGRNWKEAKEISQL